MSKTTVGILTVSDSCYRKEKEDIAGKKLAEVVQKTFPEYIISHRAIISDDKDAIISILNQWVSASCNLILTTGGTGFSPRDNTPEATRNVIEREASGLSYAMLTKSLDITPMAMLSRGICGIRDKSIIVNLPGSTKGATECFSFIVPALPHALALVIGNDESVQKVHQQLQYPYNNKFGPSKVCIDIVNRKRESPFPLVEVDDAQKIIFEKTKPITDTESIPIEDALGRILAEDIYSKEPVPAFNASIKDGYAISYNPDDYIKNESGYFTKKVITFSAAGDSPLDITLKKDEAIRICTGAPVPSNAIRIIPVEETSILATTEDGKEESVIRINYIPETAPNEIRMKGSDIPPNSKLFTKNEVLSSAHVGILASIPKLMVEVYKLPSVVGILSTGNEVVNYNESIETGQIRDTNRLTLINLLKEHHFKSVDLGIARDNPDDIKNKIGKALLSCDIVISTGGVSMGEFDLIKQVLVEDFDAQIHFGRVNMKPGKPTTFATLTFQGKQKIFFGLPGNPVSAGVTCLLFVIPLLKYLKQEPNPHFPILWIKLEEKLGNKDIRPEYVRVAIKPQNDGLVAKSTGNQISSRLNSLAGANGLLLLPPKTTPSDGPHKTLVFGNIL